jgi:hypothetical protein
MRDFKEALDALREAGVPGTSIGDRLARHAGEPERGRAYTQRLRQARMEVATVAEGRRPEPEGWPLAAAECAEERAELLLRLAQEIRETHGLPPREG